jgi:hypothetical protein
MAVTMKNAVFWDVVLCRYFLTRRLQLPAHAGSLFVDFLYPEDGGDTFLRNVG